MQDGLSREQSGKFGVTITETLSVTTTPMQIPFYLCKSVYFEAAGSNTDYIYVGNGPGVTKNNGAEIAPNGGVGWVSDTSDRFWAIANSGTQILYCIISNSGESIQRSGGNVPGSGGSSVNVAQVGGSNVTLQNFGDQITAIASFQQAVTTSAAALASHACNVMLVKNDDSSTQNVYVGGSGVSISTGVQLTPGEGMTINASNTNVLYVRAAGTGATVDVLYG